jgi:hypothetical protein
MRQLATIPSPGSTSGCNPRCRIEIFADLGCRAAPWIKSVDQVSGSRIQSFKDPVVQGFGRSRMDRQGHSFPLFETLWMDGDRFDPYNFPVLQLCLFSTGYGNSTEQVFFGLRGTFGALRHISLLY